MTASQLDYAASFFSNSASLSNANGAVVVRDGKVIGAGWDIKSESGHLHALELLVDLFPEDLAEGALVVCSRQPCDDCLIMLGVSGCCGVTWPDGGELFNPKTFLRELAGVSM